MAALSGNCECKIGSKLVQTWCIHIHMQNPLVRAQSPWIMSTLSTAVSGQPLNYVHSSTSPTTKKERSTIPARMSCCLWTHVKMAAVSLLINGTKVVVASGYNPCISEKGDPKDSGKLFNTHSRPTGENWKKASSSLYLDELLIQKCKFRHRFTVHS